MPSEVQRAFLPTTRVAGPPPYLFAEPAGKGIASFRDPAGSGSVAGPADADDAANPAADNDVATDGAAAAGTAAEEVAGLELPQAVAARHAARVTPSILFVPLMASTLHPMSPDGLRGLRLAGRG
jgi:hypothetical protein